MTDPDFDVLIGRLSGIPDSWFRLLRSGDELSGIIDDGLDTYLVEPRRRVAGFAAILGGLYRARERRGRCGRRIGLCQ